MSKRVDAIFERAGFFVFRNSDYIELSQYTPAGEDWRITLEKPADIIDYAEMFDPDEEFEMWMEAKQNGVAGVPKGSELWKDQLWKKNVLNKVAEKITKLIKKYN